MSKIAAAFVLIAAVAGLLPAAALGDSVPQFVVEGRVFCDTCKLGYETTASTYLAGVPVTVQCLSSQGAKTCSFDGMTNEAGTYHIPVSGEHEFDLCEVLLVKSSHSQCGKALPDRGRAPVFLTSNNGMATDIRYANAVGYQGEHILAVCSDILKKYEYDD